MQGISFLVAPIPCHAFFEKLQLECLFGDDLLEITGFAAQILDLIGIRSTG